MHVDKSKDSHAMLHERVAELESNHKAVLTRIDGVESKVGALEGKIDKVLDFVSDARHKQLPPVQTILVTTLTTMGILSMVLGGFFWLVDARVGSAVKRADALVIELADGPNNLFVRLHDYDLRIAELEHMLRDQPRKTTEQIMPKGRK
jgi:hypothetical protein